MVLTGGALLAARGSAAVVASAGGESPSPGFREGRCIVGTYTREDALPPSRARNLTACIERCAADVSCLGVLWGRVELPHGSDFRCLFAGSGEDARLLKYPCRFGNCPPATPFNALADIAPALMCYQRIWWQCRAEPDVAQISMAWLHHATGWLQLRWQSLFGVGVALCVGLLLVRDRKANVLFTTDKLTCSPAMAKDASLVPSAPAASPSAKRETSPWTSTDASQQVNDPSPVKPAPTRGVRCRAATPPPPLRSPDVEQTPAQESPYPAARFSQDFWRAVDSSPLPAGAKPKFSTERAPCDVRATSGAAYVMDILNSGDIEDIEQLKHIGRKSASLIAEYVREGGQVQKASDLYKKAGIRKAIARQLADAYGLQ